jgi:hypothetical protein
MGTTENLQEELDCVPMPASVVAAVRKLWAGEIRDAGGRPIYAPPKQPTASMCR